MTLTLLHTPESLCSQKVRVGLAEAGLPWVSRIVDLPNGEQFTPEYRKLNPDSVVPVLLHDAVVVRESSVILDYIDTQLCGGRLGSGAAWLPARFWLLRGLPIHDAINALTFATAIRAIDLQRTPDERAARWARLSNPLTAAKRRDLFENGLASVHVSAALIFLRQTLAEIDAALSQGPWLAGAAYSLADLALTAYVDRLDRLGLAALWADRPQIADWLARLQARPSMAAIVDAVGPVPQEAGRSAIWAAVL